jgi:mono/diheme cytochrome c family protein
MRLRSAFLLLLLVLPLLALSRSAREGVYTTQQAARGKTLYGEECAKCHGENLSGGDGSPELSGAEFLSRWNGKTLGTLFNLVRKTMPTDDPGRLSTRQYADLVAFLLSSNGFPAGDKELENNADALNDIRIEEKQ